MNAVELWIYAGVTFPFPNKLQIGYSRYTIYTIYLAIMYIDIYVHTKSYVFY